MSGSISISLTQSIAVLSTLHHARTLSRLVKGICGVCLSQEGIIALWKGWLPSVIGVIPYVGLNFAVYETLKDSGLKYYGKGSYANTACKSEVHKVLPCHAGHAASCCVCV